MGLRYNADGSLRPFTDEEVEAMGVQSRGVRDGSNPTQVRAVNASTITTKSFVPWDRLDDAVAYMVGGAAKWYDPGSAGRLSRVMPQTFPGLPDFACVKLESATGHKFDKDDPDLLPRKFPGYKCWDCVWTWQHMPFRLGEDFPSGEDERYVQTLPSTHETQYLTMPGGFQKYLRADGVGRPHNAPIPYSVGFPVCTATVRRKWVRVPWNCWGSGTGAELFKRVHGDPAAGTRPYIGSVNQKRIFGYDPWTLLLLGVEEEIDLDPLGDRLCWNLTYTWQFDPQTHFSKFFFETDSNQPATVNGWYFSCNATNNTHYSPTGLADPPDDAVRFPVRNHYDLFKVG